MSNFATLTRGASYSGRTGGAAALASARHYAFLLVPNFSMIAFANAVEVLRMANQVSGRDIFKWSVCSVDGPGVVASNGVELDAVPLDSADAVDVLFVCGGNDVQRLANADHIEAVHLVDVVSGDSREASAAHGQAVVYLWSMRDNVWTAAARLRPGERVKVRLRPWPDVSAQYEKFTRTELEDSALQLEEPVWGENIELLKL